MTWLAFVASHWKKFAIKEEKKKKKKRFFRELSKAKAGGSLSSVQKEVRWCGEHNGCVMCPLERNTKKFIKILDDAFHYDLFLEMQ